ncbi:hypothetical protein D9M72_387160 [compost metagenome]
MVFVAEDVAELGRRHRNVPDQAFVGSVGFHIQHADAGNDRSRAGFEELPEELVHPANEQHGRPGFRQFLQRGFAGEQVVLDDQLAAVLAASAHDQVDAGRELVADVVFEEFRGVAVPAQALLEYQRVAPVAVDVHVARVQLQDTDGSLAHETTSTVVILESSRRMASIAVYVQKMRLGLPLAPWIKAARAGAISGLTAPTATSSYCSRRAMS